MKLTTCAILLTLGTGALAGCPNLTEWCRKSCQGKNPPMPRGCTQPRCFCGAFGEDCAVSDWSSWSTCSKTCGGGTQTRTRTITSPPSGNGAACPALSATRACNTRSCCTPTPTACGMCNNCHCACGCAFAGCTDRIAQCQAGCDANKSSAATKEIAERAKEAVVAAKACKKSVAKKLKKLCAKCGKSKMCKKVCTRAHKPILAAACKSKSKGGLRRLRDEKSGDDECRASAKKLCARCPRGKMGKPCRAACKAMRAVCAKKPAKASVAKGGEKKPTAASKEGKSAACKAASKVCRQCRRRQKDNKALCQAVCHGAKAVCGKKSSDKKKGKEEPREPEVQTLSLAEHQAAQAAALAASANADAFGTVETNLAAEGDAAEKGALGCKAAAKKLCAKCPRGKFGKACRKACKAMKARCKKSEGETAKKGAEPTMAEACKAARKLCKKCAAAFGKGAKKNDKGCRLICRNAKAVCGGKRLRGGKQ